MFIAILLHLIKRRFRNVELFQINCKKGFHTECAKQCLSNYFDKLPSQRRVIALRLFVLTIGLLRQLKTLLQADLSHAPDLGYLGLDGYKTKSLNRVLF